MLNDLIKKKKMFCFFCSQILQREDGRWTSCHRCPCSQHVTAEQQRLQVPKESLIQEVFFIVLKFIKFFVKHTASAWTDNKKILYTHIKKTKANTEKNNRLQNNWTLSRLNNKISKLWLEMWFWWESSPVMVVKFSH